VNAMADDPVGLDEMLARSLRDTGPARPPEVESRMRELRAWQSARLGKTYEDFLGDPLSADAVRFFLTDLYGPEEHPRRDSDLVRAWSRLKRTLPEAALELLGRALELQLLTAELDSALVGQLEPGLLTWATYAAAYRAVGRAEERTHQIELVLKIGEDLSRIVHHEWLALAVRLARLPAHLAGFGALQDFLERGFNAFRRLGDARRLLEAVRERETRLSAALLAGANPPEDIARAGQ
jgi:hypothetical protein